MTIIGNFAVRIVSQDGTTHHKGHHTDFAKAKAMADDLLFTDAKSVLIYDYNTKKIVYQFPK